MEFLTQIKRWENRILKRRLKIVPPWVLRIQTTLWKHCYLKVFYSFYVLIVYWIEEKEKRRNEQLKNHYLKRRDWCSTLQYPEWMISVPEDLFDTISTESGWYSLLRCFSTVFVGMSPADWKVLASSCTQRITELIFVIQMAISLPLVPLRFQETSMSHSIAFQWNA